MKLLILLALMLQTTDPHPSGWLIAPGVGAEAYSNSAGITIKVTVSKKILFVDSLKRKKRPNSMYFFGLCELKGIIQGGVIAYARYKFDHHYSGVIHQAWRINVEKRKLDAITTKGLRCINESYPGNGD